jgi:hypothetical protein
MLKLMMVINLIGLPVSPLAGSPVGLLLCNTGVLPFHETPPQQTTGEYFI